ncbi:MAG: AMP-binding protein, partial [Prochloraceae cyanobacterium]
MTFSSYQKILNFTPDNRYNLVDILKKRAQTQTHQIAYTFLVDGETQEINLTYQQLDRDARAIAAHLQAFCQPGDRALLLYPSGLDFVKAFFGCLYAGIVAVPAYPPRRNQNMSRLEGILKDALPRVVLTIKSLSSNIERRLAQISELSDLYSIATDIIPQEKSSLWQEPELKEDTLAFLQYTSGSTGNPKGVMVTHDNIIHNLEIISDCFDHTTSSKGVIWLPPYHDMGLIGGILQPLFVGFPVVAISPLHFLQKPLRWLQAISRYKATTSGGPNFAYDLCVKKIKPEQLASLDLSSWEVAFTGAEPIRAQTLKQFGNKFASCGFRYRAFYPCYGMAENTLLATGGLKNSKPVIIGVNKKALAKNEIIKSKITFEGTQALVGSGLCDRLDNKVIVVNPNSLTRCQTAEVGEIWISGSSVTSGYWNQPETTQKIFQAYLSDTGEGPFLRTGDLGFLKDGELFVTGRIKDLIIIRGRNHYPQDLEVAAEKSHPSLQEGCAAAFTIDREGDEQLVIAIEIQRTYLRKLNINEIARKIRQAISEEFHLQVYGVLLLKTATIPKTSSGKIQRRATCEKFLANELNLVGSSLLDSSKEDLDESTVAELKEEEYLVKDSELITLEKKLKQIIEIALNIKLNNLDSKTSLNSLGIDSLGAIELQNQIESTLGVFLPMSEFLSGLTIGELTKEILESTQKFAREEGIKPVSRERQIPLSFGGERLWFLNRLIEKDNIVYNEQIAWNLKGNLNLVALKQALRQIMQRHEILRTAFKVLNNNPVQIIEKEPILNIRVENIENSLSRVEKIASEEILQPFDLAKPPLIRFTILKLQEQEYVVLITIHHIVCDGWSLGIFIEELSSLYQAFCKGDASPLPELPIQYADFAVWQRKWLSTKVRETQLNYWKQQLEGAPELLQLPTDRPRPVVQTYRGAARSFSLNTD